jgi:hypothetical protein
MTRSMLRGDTRWQQFFGAQVRASLVNTIMAAHHLNPYIRRFKNEAGCTLQKDMGAVIDIRRGRELAGIVGRTSFAVKSKFRIVPSIRRHEDPLHWSKSWIQDLQRVFEYLEIDLRNAGYVQKVRMSSPTSGASIVSRIVKPFGKEKEMLLKMADE